MRRIRFTLGWGFMTLLSIAILVVAVPQYLLVDEEFMFQQQVEVYLANLTPIVGHVAGGALALLLGPTQFLPALRRGRRRAFHRWSGRLYLVGIAVGGSFGLWMSFLAYGGIVGKAGFFGLSLAWLTTGAVAYSRIRAGDTDLHREWMIRSFALTFAAVTLRIWLGVSQASGVDFDVAYPVIAWVAWVPNLLVAEWWIRRGRRQLAPTTAAA